MSTTEAVPPYVGILTGQLQRVSKLLASVIERLEAVENLQAVTAYEQADVVETLARLSECVRLLLDAQRMQARTAVMADDVFANSTAHEEYRLS